jgi:FMN-dependent NADH-azoreductase
MEQLQVIEQFKSADKCVVAVPMWNFSIPYRPKQQIDLLVQSGYTVSYGEGKRHERLVSGKLLFALVASVRLAPGLKRLTCRASIST